jgi:copper chaperone CopZ
VVGTVVLKIGSTGLHCDGCMKRVRAKLFKIKGTASFFLHLINYYYW